MDTRKHLKTAYQDEKVARAYDAEREFRDADLSLHYETEIGALLEALKDIKGPILEVAVGTGRLCRRLRGIGYPYVGLDFSMPMLQEANKSLGSDGGGIFLLRGDAFQLPFKEEYFQAVIGFRFIKHLDPENRRILYKELGRVMQKGGILTFDFYGWRRRAKKGGGRLTVKALRAELEESGLRLLKVYGTRHILCDILSVPFRRLKIRPVVKALGWLEIKVLSRIDGLLDRSRGGIAVCQKLGT
jgi:ubiquinone/menaquinone biosynthesis C-methylase UbiE